MTISRSLTSALLDPESVRVPANNILINGDHIVSQECGDTLIASSHGRFVTDQWSNFVSGAAVISGQRLQTTPPSGFSNYMRYKVTTIDASIAASDLVRFYQPIEGYRWACLGFGAAGAQSFTVGFWVRSSLTGTFGWSIINGTANRGYTKLFTISVADTWEFKTFVVPGDTSGTWVTTNAVAAYFRITLMSGTDYQTATPETWLANQTGTTSAQTNWAATLNATFDFTGCSILPGALSTVVDQASMFRKFGLEELECQYFWQKLGGDLNNHILGVGQNNSTTSTEILAVFKRSMRTNPTVALVGTVSLNSGTANGVTSSTLTSTLPSRHNSYLLFSSLSASLVQGNGCLAFFATPSSNYITADARI